MSLLGGLGAGVPHAIAAVLLALRDATGVRPHCYFAWAEGSPLAHLLRYLLLGHGGTVPVVREIIRKTEPDIERRPGDPRRSRLTWACFYDLRTSGNEGRNRQ